MKKFLSLFLAVVMVLSLITVPVYAEDNTISGTVGIQTGTDGSKVEVDFSKFKDVKGHWAEADLKWAVDNGLMTGVTITKMQPNSGITRAQMATMVVRAFGATQSADISMFVDVKKDDWCYESIARAVKMECLSTFGNSIQPNEKVSREEVASTLVKAAGYTLVDSNYLNGYTDRDTVSALNQQYIATAIANEIMTGYADNTLKPEVKVTRAQFAVMMRRLASAHMTKVSTYSSKKVDGSLLVGVGGLTLNGMEVTKNVFLTDGCGTGEIKLTGTRVDGTMFVRGTGPSTVYISGNSRVNHVVLCNPNNAVSLVVEEGSSVGSVNVQKVVSSATIKGDVRDVTILTGSGPVKLTGADVQNLSLDSKFAAVQIDEGSSVRDVVLSPSASGADLDVVGTCDRVTVNAPNSKVNIHGKVHTLEFGNRAEECNLSIDSKATVSNVDLGVNELKLSLIGVMENADIGGNDSEITFASGASLKRVDVDGDGTDVEFASGSKTEKVYTTGNDLRLTGSGEVTDIQINDGKNIRISIPGARVYNKGGTNVKVGDVTVGRGETVVVNSTGDGIVVDTNGNPVTDPSKPGTSTNPGGIDNGQTNKTFVITLVPNGGTLAVAQTTTDQYGTIPALPTPVYEKHTFLGWFTAKDGGIERKAGQKLTAHTTLYAQWKAEGSGTNPGGDPDVNPPSGGQVVTVNLSLPINGQPSDFGFESAYTYSMFGSGLSLFGGVLSGTVTEIKDFKWLSGDMATGYYVPVVVSPQIRTSDCTLKIGDRVYGNEMYSTGTGYNGEIIGYLYLNPYGTNKTIDITVDPDGSGTQYAPVTTTVSYSTVVFKGEETESNLYKGITVMEGVDGAETPKLERTSADDTNLVYNFALTAESLLETSKEGRYGNWVGLKIPAPSDAVSCQVTESITGSSNNQYSLPVRQESDETGYATSNYITWWTDVSKLPADRQITLELLWSIYTGVSDYHKATLKLDLSGVKLAGEKPAEGTTPIVSGVSLTVMTDEECVSQFGWNLDKFGVDIRSDGSQAFAGVFIPASGTSDVGGFEIPEAYWVPLKITGVAAGECDVRRSESAGIRSKMVTDAADDGSFTVYCLLEIQSINSGIGSTPIEEVADIKISFVPKDATKFSAVSQVIDGSNAELTSADLVPLEVKPTGTVDGIDVSTLWKSGANPQYRRWRNWLDVGPTYTEEKPNNDCTLVKKTSATLYGKSYQDVWILPVVFRAIGGDTGYTIRITGVKYDSEATGADVGNTEIASLKPDQVFNVGEGILLLPVAVGSKKFDNITVEQVFDDESKNTKTYSVYFMGTCDGFTESTTKPEPEPTPTPEPPTLTIGKATESLSTWLSVTDGYDVTLSITKPGTTTTAEEGKIVVTGSAKALTESGVSWKVPVLVGAKGDDITSWSAKVVASGSTYGSISATSDESTMVPIMVGQGTDISNADQCNNFTDVAMTLEVYDESASGSPVLIGSYKLDLTGVTLSNYPTAASGGEDVDWG